VDQIYKVDHSQWKDRLDVLDTIYEESENLITFISDIIEMKTNMEIRLKTGKEAL